jgi:hypothetical protein
LSARISFLLGQGGAEHFERAFSDQATLRAQSSAKKWESSELAVENAKRHCSNGNNEYSKGELV